MKEKKSPNLADIEREINKKIEPINTTEVTKHRVDLERLKKLAEKLRNFDKDNPNASTVTRI